MKSLDKTNRLSTLQRLAAGFIAMLVIMAVITAISINRVQNIVSMLDVVNDVNSVKQRYAINFRGSVHDRAISLRDVVMLDAQAARLDEEATIRRLAENYAVSAKALDAVFAAGANVTDEERKYLADIKASEAEMLPMINAVIAARSAGDVEQARSMLLTEAAPAFRQWLARINTLIDHEEAKNKQVGGEASAAARSFRNLMLQLYAVALLLSVAIAYISLGTIRPLRRLEADIRALSGGNNQIELVGLERTDEVGAIARAFQAFRQATVERTEADAVAAAEQKLVVDAMAEGLATLARGDMTSVIRVEFPPAFARAKENFTSATSNLRHMIQAVVENAETIRASTDEIAAASEDIARRTESNAASLEESSAALVQIDDRLKATTTGSISTVARADQAIATVASGRSTADQAVQAMGRVSVSAKGIDSVIEGVDKIAFQTRVLAMNAAVEAGRAGDAGRGFAVVADLVSALAMRAEDEAKRARDQLTVTQAEIVTAVSAVQRVDGSLVAIAGDVEAVHGLLETMVSDTQAQSLAVTEITAAIASMDLATQQNAAMVEQTSAAARSLTVEVVALATAASAFEFERRSNNITPIVERRVAPQKLAKAAKPKIAPPAPVRPAAVRTAGTKSPKLVAVQANNAADWSDF